MSRNRRFTFTWNNYTEDSLGKLKSLKCKHMVVGQETGELGTDHYQGYIEFKEAKTLKSVIKKLKGCHIEIAKGSAMQNKEYCSKENMVYTFGEPYQQGKRNDLKDLHSKVKAGESIRNMLNNDDIKNYQGLKTAEALMKYVEPCRTEPPKVIWRYGESGVGKTKWVYENYTEVFVPTSFKWWEGYDGHEVVLLDEIRGDFCKYHEILKLLDRYPYRVECKGGSRQLLCKTIIITSNRHPSCVWNTMEDSKQLLRRIHEICEIE